MLQFVVLGDGQGESRSIICDKAPFLIGRGTAADLQLDAPGVWEAHAQIAVDLPSGKWRIAPIGEALLLINGERSAGRVLLPNDEIRLGGATLRVSLSPVRQRNIQRREIVVWALLLLVAISELILLLQIS
jgi:hypothetical protein